MGNTQGFQNVYAVPLKNTQTADTTPILRAATHPDNLVKELPNESINNSWDLFTRGVNVSGNQRCLGYREKSSKDGSLAPTFSWVTYNEMVDFVKIFGSYLLQLEGAVDVLHFDDEEYGPAKDMRLLGIFSKNRLEWFVCEQAANAYGLAIVPIYDTLGQEALGLILERTCMRTVASSLECLPALLTAMEVTGNVKYVVMFLDPHEKVDDALEARCEAAGAKMIKYDDIIQNPLKNFLPFNPCGLDGINTLCFTSGTTGNPKGVLLTHMNVVSCSTSLMRGPVSGDMRLYKSDTTISYLPLAHVLERLVCNVVFALGGSIGIYSGDTATLLDDVRVLQPTVFVSVPRLFNRINDAVFRGVSQKSAIAKMLFNRGMSRKLEVLRTNATTTNKLWDPLVFAKTRQLMGGNLRFMISGGAPLDAVVQEHMKILFCAPLMEGYGMTETFGPTFLANPLDPVSGHVGGVVPANEFCLKSVPEMNYSVNDSPPRGELLIRGHAISVGYFRDAEETRATYDADGWLHTGDIAVVLPGGALKIIDRRKNIFKLAQGEYIAPEKIEGVYLQAPLIAQMFVFGYSDKNVLVAIVVPDPDATAQWAKKQSPPATGTLETLINHPQLKTDILKEMEETAKACGLKGFEKVKNFHLEWDPLTVENNMLTPTLKIKRHEARKRYQKEIDAMYDAMK